MKKIIIIIFVLLLNFPLQSQDYQAAFVKANTAFEQGDYLTAANLYEKILAKKQFSFEVYYNLGNAYFKLEQIPKAILNYERALRFRPQSTDTHYNLKLANQRTIDQISEMPSFFVLEWWENWCKLGSATSWAVLTIVFLFLSCLAFAFYILEIGFYSRKNILYSSIVLLLFAKIFFLTALQRQHVTHHRSAILFSKTSPLKTSADGLSPTILELHEGVKVDLLDRIGQWRKVRLPNGEQGWLSVNELVEI